VFYVLRNILLFWLAFFFNLIKERSNKMIKPRRLNRVNCTLMQKGAYATMQDCQDFCVPKILGYDCAPDTGACVMQPDGQWEENKCKCMFEEVPMNNITVLSQDQSLQNSADFFPEITGQPGPSITSHTYIIYTENVRGPWVDIVLNDLLVIQFTFVQPTPPLRYVYVFIERLPPYSHFSINESEYMADCDPLHPYIMHKEIATNDGTLLLNMVGSAVFIIHMIGFSAYNNLSIYDAYDYFCPIALCAMK